MTRNGFVFILVLFVFSCKNSRLEQALLLAGPNRTELEKVIAHYSSQESDSLKLKAALFLIENMPGHYSYKGNAILAYYKEAEPVLLSELSAAEKEDSIKKISAKYPNLSANIVSDIQIITAGYLIKNIDRSFELWGNPWAKHLTFDQFCEYILPYKCFELQQLDGWRDTLSGKFTNDLYAFYRDETYDSPFHASQMVLNELRRTVKASVTYARPYYPFQSASTIYKVSSAPCDDYVKLGVSTLRSAGVPVVMESIPQWGRHYLGHTFYSLLNDHGKMMPSPWDITSNPGMYSFPTERIPKVFRYSYAINRQTEEYLKKASYRHPAVDVFKKDVTDEYTVTSDLSVPVLTKKLEDRYVYIAVFNNKDWNVVDYGMIDKEHAEFKKMGRNALYIVLGFNGNGLIPVSYPFVLDQAGKVEYFVADTLKKQQVVLTRKYPKSANVANMQYRILHGRIQASDTENFSDPVTLYTIDNLEYPDLISLHPDKPYRYWRYLAPDMSYGNISELQFFQDTADKRVMGKIIGTEGVPGWEREKAFDNDWLTCFQTEASDHSWIGMDFGKPVLIQKVRCIPRTDDNYIHVGDKYELKFWDSSSWHSLGTKVADENHLIYDQVPEHAVLWLSNLTRGREERIFVYKGNKQIWW